MKNNEREIQELADTIRRGNIRIIGILKSEEKEQGLEGVFRQIVDENFPNLRNELEIGIQELADTIRRGNIRIMGITEGEEKEEELESIFRQIVDKNVPHLRNELKSIEHSITSSQKGLHQDTLY